MSFAQPHSYYRIRSLNEHAWLLQQSLLRLTGLPLVKGATTGAEVLDYLERADIAVVSHGTEQDPVFNYGNAMALRLFEMDSVSFTQLVSRKSAEVPNREERNRLLEAVTRQGYIDHYSGIRISASGRRFRIEAATVWNLHNSEQLYCGQAACIRGWTYLDV